MFVWLCAIRATRLAARPTFASYTRNLHDQALHLPANPQPDADVAPAAGAKMEEEEVENEEETVEEEEAAAGAAFAVEPQVLPG